MLLASGPEGWIRTSVLVRDLFPRQVGYRYPTPGCTTIQAVKELGSVGGLAPPSSPSEEDILSTERYRRWDARRDSNADHLLRREVPYSVGPRALTGVLSGTCIRFHWFTASGLTI